MSVDKLDSLFRWWKSRSCKHVWRPAIKEVDRPAGFLMVRRISTPVRLCSKCDKVEICTVPEFYAQFGRMPW